MYCVLISGQIDIEFCRKLDKRCNSLYIMKQTSVIHQLAGNHQGQKYSTPSYEAPLSRKLNDFLLSSLWYFYFAIHSLRQGMHMFKTWRCHHNSKRTDGLCTTATEIVKEVLLSLWWFCLKAYEVALSRTIHSWLRFSCGIIDIEFDKIVN